MSNWTEDQIQAVWEKGTEVSGYDKNKYRKDQCGAWIQRDKHGDTKHIFGWEIDHIHAVSKDGTDAPSNLRPLQWENNRGRSDGKLKTVVTSDGKNNIRKSDEAA